MKQWGKHNSLICFTIFGNFSIVKFIPLIYNFSYNLSTDAEGPCKQYHHHHFTQFLTFLLMHYLALLSVDSIMFGFRNRGKWILNFIKLLLCEQDTINFLEFELVLVPLNFFISPIPNFINVKC